jgi:hypothetical protein
MISFRIAPHSTRPVNIVEVLDDGGVIATIVPTDSAKSTISLTVISAHMRTVVHDDGRRSNPPIPAVTVTFDPEPYEIKFGAIIRMRR